MVQAFESPVDVLWLAPYRYAEAAALPENCSYKVASSLRNVRFGMLQELDQGKEDSVIVDGVVLDGAFNAEQRKQLLDGGKAFADAAAPVVDVKIKEATPVVDGAVKAASRFGAAALREQILSLEASVDAYLADDTA